MGRPGTATYFDDDLLSKVSKKEEEKKKEVQIQATRLFYENMYSKAEYVINRGSSRSSKSYSIAQVMCHKFLNETNKTFLIVRRSLPSLRLSVYQTMKRVLDSFGASTLVKEEKVGMNWYYGSNWLHFGSIDDIEKIKSTEWNYIWIEEATDFTFDEYLILTTRLSGPVDPSDPNQNKMYLSFNPIDEHHWIKNKLVDDKQLQARYRMGLGGVQEIVSTYKDNPTLTDRYVQILEGLINQDFNMYRIYALGEWGALTNLIYTNWQPVQYFPDMGKPKIIYGLDFGFNDPMALVRIMIKGFDTYEEQLIYQSGLTVKDLMKQMDILIPSNHRRVPIYCDSSEPDKIIELRNNGYNARPSLKSIMDGVDFVKRFNCHILDSSTELLKELRSYSWRTDKNGTVLDEPVDYQNHLQDARRYALYTHLRGSLKYNIRFINA